MKNLLRFLVIVLVFSAGFWFGRLQVQAPAENLNNNQALKEIKVDLLIDFGSEKTQEYKEVVLSPNANVYDLLKEVEKNKNLKLEVKDYGSEMGVLILGLGEVLNDPKTGTYWQLWINGEYAKVGASSLSLKDGDRVEWKYLKSQIK